MEVSDEEPEMKVHIPIKPIFKQPENKFMKYKPRKSIEIDRELSMSDMEFVTSVQVDDDINSKMSSRSTISQLSQGSLSLVKSFEISGVNAFENSVEPVRERNDFPNFEIPKVINEHCFEDMLASLTVAKLGEKSILICPEERCRGSMKCKENSVLICRKCERTRNLEEDYKKPNLELSESLMDFQNNFQTPKFEVDFSVLDKFKNQPTFDDIFKKIENLHLDTRPRMEGPFYDWINETKMKLKEMSRNPVVSLSRLVNTLIIVV